MRVIMALATFVFFLAGLGLLGYAVIYPFGFQLTSASALQVSQVYGTATFYALLGIGSLIAAVVCILSVVEQRVEEANNIQKARGSATMQS